MGALQVGIMCTFIWFLGCMQKYCFCSRFVGTSLGGAGVNSILGDWYLVFPPPQSRDSGFVQLVHGPVLSLRYPDLLSNAVGGSLSESGLLFDYWELDIVRRWNSAPLLR